jgi:hypothetical protein
MTIFYDLHLFPPVVCVTRAMTLTAGRWTGAFPRFRRPCIARREIVAPGQPPRLAHLLHHRRHVYLLSMIQQGVEPDSDWNLGLIAAWCMLPIPAPSSGYIVYGSLDVCLEEQPRHRRFKNYAMVQTQVQAGSQRDASSTIVRYCGWPEALKYTCDAYPNPQPEQHRRSRARRHA